jgi:hypothetical protein
LPPRGGVAIFRLISARSGSKVPEPQWGSLQRRHFGAFMLCSPSNYVRPSNYVPPPVKQCRGPPPVKQCRVC